MTIAGRLSNEEDTFVDGAVIAAARSLPSWSDGDIPPSPSRERKAVKELQEECQRMLAAFPTTSEQDQKILGTPCSPKVKCKPLKKPQDLLIFEDINNTL